MRMSATGRLVCLFACVSACFARTSFSTAHTNWQCDRRLPSETPAKLEPATESFDYVKRDEMIPMRDGVKLHTVIVIPKGAKNAPILVDADSLQRQLSGQSRAEFASRPDSERVRQCRWK